MAKVSLGELADRLEAELVGSRDLEISGLRALAEAGPAELSFIHQAGYRSSAESSRAAAFVVPRNLREMGESLGRPLLLVGHSQLAVARALAVFHPRVAAAAGVHPTAIVAADAELGEGVSIGPYAVIGDGCRIGARTTIEAHVTVGRGCRLGADVLLHPHVVLYDGIELGDRVEIHSGSVIGADGFGYATARGVHHKVPQVGKVVLEDDVEVGACSTIDRATIEATRIGAGSKVDNLVQVGHNVSTGKGCLLCGQVGIAGSTKLGDYVVLAGGAGVNGHIELGTGVQLAAASVALQSVEPGKQLAGSPAMELRDWRRMVTTLPRLADLFRRVKKLEQAAGPKAGAAKAEDGDAGDAGEVQGREE